MKIFLLLSFFIFSPSWAEWVPETAPIARALNDNYKNSGDSYLMTAWGGWQRLFSWSSVKGEIVQAATSFTKTGNVEYYRYRHSSKDPRPLFILFPGIFGEPGQRVTDNFIEMLEALDGHVIVVPNFLSMGWVRGYPLYGEGDPSKTELNITHDIWRDVIKYIPESSISKVHVVGESLGTLISSAWVSQKEWKPRPSSLTLLWPPLELDRALDNIDLYVTTLESDWKRCGLFFTLPIFMKYFVMDTTPKEISQTDGRCLSAWVAYMGFQKTLRNVYTVHAETNKVPDLNPATFKFFFQSYRKPFWDTIQKRDQTMHLGYWLKKIKIEQSLIDLQVLSSRDDFLNEGFSWESWRTRVGLNENEIILLDWGGHSGPVAAKEFELLLQTEFMAKK